MKDTDRDWEILAQQEPYWAVLSAEKFRFQNLTPKARKEFFETGVVHIRQVHEVLQSTFGAPSRFEISLDFGSGVGRLLLALAQISNHVVGVEVSQTMREHCLRNAQESGIDHIEVFPSSSDLKEIEHYRESIDLITSFLVLQHIPPDRGMCYIQRLLRLLKPGGYGYLELSYADRIGSLPKEAGFTTGNRYAFYQRLGPHLLRIAEHIDDEDPLIMQMNHYNLNEVCGVFAAAGVSQVHARLRLQGDVASAELYFQKA